MVRARELKFWENVHPPKRVKCHMSRVMCHVSCVTCHMSRVTCHVSHVTCHMSHLFIFFFFPDKVVELIGGRSVINGATPSSFITQIRPLYTLAVSTNIYTGVFPGFSRGWLGFSRGWPVFSQGFPGVFPGFSRGFPGFSLGFAGVFLGFFWGFPGIFLLLRKIPQPLKKEEERKMKKITQPLQNCIRPTIRIGWEILCLSQKS